MRLALITDIHEDYEFLKRVLAKIEAYGFDQLICLGDISGFSKPFYRYKKTRDALASLKLIREKGHVIIPGNHDMHVAARIPEHSAIFDFPPDWYSLDFSKRAELSGHQIWLHEDDHDTTYTREDLAFLASLPEFEVLDNSDCKILLSHYAYPNLSGFSKKFYSWEGEFKAHFKFMEQNACSLSFIGHAHPRGFYLASPKRFRQYGYRKLKLKELPAIIGIPPVTRHRMRSGFCIFDTSSRVIEIKKQF